MVTLVVASGAAWVFGHVLAWPETIAFISALGTVMLCWAVLFIVVIVKSRSSRGKNGGVCPSMDGQTLDGSGRGETRRQPPSDSPTKHP